VSFQSSSGSVLLLMLMISNLRSRYPDSNLEYPQGY